MKIILLFLYLLSDVIHADRDGIIERVWESVPMQIYNETEPLINESVTDPEIVDSDIDIDKVSDESKIVDQSLVTKDEKSIQKVVPKSITTTADKKIREILDSIKKSDTNAVKNSTNSDKIVKSTINNPLDSSGVINIGTFDQLKSQLLDFLDPLLLFLRENTKLAIIFFTFILLSLYLLFYRPLSKRANESLHEDMDISEYNQNKLNEKASILTQNQYSTLYGLINETFLYEKEKIVLNMSITQERKNRETMALDWKLNHVLHFLLPKLSTDNSRHFIEGVKELISEELTRDLMLVSMRDILKSSPIDDNEKRYLYELLEKERLKDRRVVEKVYS